MKSLTMLLCGCFLAAALQGQVIYVHPDSLHNTIQSGINAADAGDTVLVLQGTYYEQINFQGKAITVASEFLTTGDQDYIDSTIIDGSQIPDGDSCSVVYFINDEDTTSILCGFTIKHGKGTFHTYANETFTSGGGIFIHTAGAKIVHNNISDNHLNDTIPGNPKFVDAAGIAIYGNTDKWVVIDHNQIDNNSCYAHQADIARVAGVFVCDHNCLITNNNISNDTCIGEGNSWVLAGAFACYSPLVNAYTAIIQSNVFEHNYVKATNLAYCACGIIQNVTGIFSDNLVKDNRSDGISTSNWDGGIFELVDPGPGSIINGNTFRGNTTNRLGGALNLMLFSAQPDHETVIVENNYFLENESSNGGALHSRDVPVLLQNNVFSGNYATNCGGAISFQKYWPPSNPHLLTLINNSFEGNVTGGYGGAIYSSFGDPLIINSIFWNDSSDDLGNEIFLQVSDTAEIAFTNIDPSKIEGAGIWYDGGGNIMGEDPLFDSDSLTILPGSPCLNAGINVFTCACGVANYCPQYDINGIGRPQSGGFEMGAYELMFTDIPAQGDHGFEAEIYPNPFKSHTTINYSLEKNTRVTITIINSFGQMIAKPVNGWQQSGEQRVVFNSEGLPAGLYFYRIEAGNQKMSGKMVLTGP